MVNLKHILFIASYCTLVCTHLTYSSLLSRQYEDTWVHVLSFLSIKNQINFAITCTHLNTLFNTRAYINDCTINLKNLQSEKTIIKTAKSFLKNLFISDIHSTENSDLTKKHIIDCICTKISHNTICGLIYFKTFSDTAPPEEICKSLAFNQSITGLNFNDCNLTEHIITTLARALSTTGSRIKHLCIQNNTLLGHNDIRKLLEQTPQLEDFDGSRNNITITKIPKNDFDSYAIDVMTQEVSKTRGTFCPHTKEEGVKVLGNNELMVLGIPNFQLKKINLSSCLLTGFHLDWIIQILQKNKNLEILILQANKLHTNQQKNLELRKQADMSESMLTLLDISNQLESRHSEDILPYNPSRTNLRIVM
jgi:hypothetical protein